MSHTSPVDTVPMPKASLPSAAFLAPSPSHKVLSNQAPGPPMTGKKVGCLVSLVVQNTLLVLTMKYTLSRQNVPRYSVASAVMVNEALKFGFSCCMLLQELRPSEICGGIMKNTLGSPFSLGKMLVPAFLYTAQNYLGYVAVGNLQPAVYQLLAQVKILTTALFSVMFLGRNLAWTQWGALHMLIIGVGLVQLSNSASPNVDVSNNLMGIFAVTTICILSGLAAVYFERILKTTSTSVWMRNVQLALVSFMIGVINFQFQDVGVTTQSFFNGYDGWVWAVILLQAGGGLIIAAVMKYADNILKCFATSISVILSCLLSLFFFDFGLTPKFLVGACLIFASAYLYNADPFSSSKQNVKHLFERNKNTPTANLT